jgi:hypothetical protein
MLSACTTTTVAARNNTQASVETPEQIWDRWYEAEKNPLVDPKPDFEKAVLKPLQSSYNALGEVLGVLNSSPFTTMARQKLVLKYMRLAIKTPEEKQAYLSVLEFLSARYDNDKELVSEYRQLKSSK